MSSELPEWALRGEWLITFWTLPLSFLLTSKQKVGDEPRRLMYAHVAYFSSGQTIGQKKQRRWLLSHEFAFLCFFFSLCVTFHLCHRPAKWAPVETQQDTSDDVTAMLLFISFYISLFFKLNAEWTVFKHRLKGDESVWMMNMLSYIAVSLTGAADFRQCCILQDTKKKNLCCTLFVVNYFRGVLYSFYTG